MNFIPASSLSLFAFVGILATVCIAFLWSLFNMWQMRNPVYSFRHSLRAAVFLLIWLSLLSLPVALGVFREFPLALFGLFGASNLAALVLGLSSVGKGLAIATDIRALVLFQGFRLPLELVLHEWFLSGTVPETMTWSGQNFDIVTGILALVLAPFAHHSAAAWFANLIGLSLLANVVRVAVMSSPFPFAWQLNSPLQLGIHLPYALIVPVCVAGALLGHIILTRKLMNR